MIRTNNLEHLIIFVYFVLFVHLHGNRNSTRDLDRKKEYLMRKNEKNRVYSKKVAAKAGTGLPVTSGKLKPMPDNSSAEPAIST